MIFNHIRSNLSVEVGQRLDRTFESKHGELSWVIPRAKKWLLCTRIPRLLTGYEMCLFQGFPRMLMDSAILNEADRHPIGCLALPIVCTNFSSHHSDP